MVRSRGFRTLRCTCACTLSETEAAKSFCFKNSRLAKENPLSAAADSRALAESHFGVKAAPARARARAQEGPRVGALKQP